MQDMTYIYLAVEVNLIVFCYSIVRELKNSYPQIILVKINAYRETEFNSIETATYFSENLEKISNFKSNIRYFDYEYSFPSSKNGVKYTYILRNYKMIDLSNLCVIYFDPNNSKILRAKSHKIIYGNSGTKLALEYAKRKKKNILLI